jgi:hypothetical protein
MSYQPTQNLTWLYVNATGQLSIVATVSVADLIPTEHLNTSAGPISGGRCDIQLTVVGGSYNTPVQIPVPYLNIGAGLQTEPIVREQIVKLGMVTITSTVYKDGTKKGDTTGTTTNGADININ